MTLKRFVHFSIFSLVFFVFRSLLGITRQESREKNGNFASKASEYVRILIYRTWAITLDSLTVETGEVKSGTRDVNSHGWLQGHPLLPQVIIKTSLRTTEGNHLKTRFL